MKDFDTARLARVSRERSFTIGGQQFVYRPSVPPEALLAWDRRGDAEGQDFLDIVDETVLAFLEPGQEDAWREVRSSAVDVPLNIGDIIDVIVWLFAEQAGGDRPIVPSSGSTNGHSTTGAPLTAVSSSPVTPPASPALTSVPSSTSPTP